MTAADVLRDCAVAGVDVYLRDDGAPAYRGSPNAALKAALKEHRAGVVALLGGAAGPEACAGYTYRFRDKAGEWREKVIDCGATVYEAVDNEFFCPARACPFREEARRRGP